MHEADVSKRAAARAAVDAIEDERRLGLGTGSTVAHVLDRLAERIATDGLDVIGVPTSEATARRARELGIAITDLDALERLDLTIDGADEVDRERNLIKGGGGALTREKIVAAASAKMYVVVGEDKLVDRLGTTFRLPVEVLDFGWRQAAIRLEQLGLEPALRTDAAGAVFRTDNGHRILDCSLPPTEDLRGLEFAVDRIPGIVECGLFLGMADRVFVGTRDGSVREV